MLADAGVPVVRPIFEPGALPLRFGDVPWPDDAYRDAAGRVQVRDLPTQGDAALATALAEGMADLDGFGVRPTIYFRFDGALDPASLPASPDATLGTDASVFLMDADTGSLADVFVIGALIRVLEPTPPAYVIDEDGGEVGSFHFERRRSAV